MSLAIAYALKKKDRQYARGGMCAAHGMQACHECHGGKMAEGGYVEEEEASGYEPNPHEKAEVYVEHPQENQEFPMEEEDMVDRIMKSRAKGYSEGGRVANDDMPEADFEENQFDVMPKEDHLEFHYTGANSGDELGNEQEDEDQHDMVSRIMRSRMKRDRMPRPA